MIRKLEYSESISVGLERKMKIAINELENLLKALEIGHFLGTAWFRGCIKRKAFAPQEAAAARKDLNYIEEMISKTKELLAVKENDMVSAKISKDEIRELVLNRELTITDFIDAVIEINSIIGVGLITLGDEIRDYIRGKCNHNET